MLFLVPAALPCGAMYAPPDGFARSDTQEAIFTRGSDSTQVDYRILYEGDTETFGWVIPIPGEFESMVDADEATFEALRAATDPAEKFEEGDEGCANTRSKDKGGGDSGSLDGAESDVTVVDTGFTGSYEYVALDATSSEALVAWLDDAGFDLGDSAEDIEAYVADGIWQFVAITLIADADTTEDYDYDYDESNYVVPPISIVYSGTELRYPARISRRSTASAQHTILYVHGAERATIAEGWSEEDLEVVRDVGEDPGYVQYEAWPEALADVGGRMTFGVVYAGEYGDGWVTRFETVAPPAIATEDVVFALDGGEEELHTLLTNTAKGCGDAAWIVLLPLGWLRRRHP